MSDSSVRVVRGGSWFGDAARVRAAYRDVGVPARRYGYIGFRIVRPILPKQDNVQPKQEKKDE